MIKFFKKMLFGNSTANIDPSQLVFLDLETTGLHTNRCGILEICLFDNQNGMFSTLIDAGQPIPAQITEINGIDRDMIVGKPRFSEIAEQIHEKIKNKIIVGHNVEFDLKFLFCELLAAGIQPKALKYICTCKAERKTHGSYGNKLTECLDRRGIRVEQKHRASDDVDLLRQLFSRQLKEKAPFKIEMFGTDKYNEIILREPGPKFTQQPKKRTTYTLKMFQDWGSKTDNATIELFNQFIEATFQDRVFDAAEMRQLAEIGVDKKAATAQLKKALSELITLYCQNGKISWEDYQDLEEVAKLLGFNSSVLFSLIKEAAPAFKVLCFTNNLIIKGQSVDRYEILFPWALSHGFLPSDSVTKQTDLVVNCDTNGTASSKITKAQSYGLDVKLMSDFMKGKNPLTP